MTATPALRSAHGLVVLVGYWLIACRPVIPDAAAAPLATSPVPPALGAWIPRFHIARFTRHEQYDALPPDIGEYRVTRTLERSEPTRALFHECEERLDRKKSDSCVLTFIGREGYGNAASPLDGGWDWWSPPQVILPPDPALGVRWQAEHSKRGASSRRECQVLDDATFCDGGLESRCFSAFPQSTVAISQHFCPGVGWVGEDAFARYEDGHLYTTFTLGLTLDGVAAPERRKRQTTGPTSETR